MQLYCTVLCFYTILYYYIVYYIYIQYQYTILYYDYLHTLFIPALYYCSKAVYNSAEPQEAELDLEFSAEFAGAAATVQKATEEGQFPDLPPDCPLGDGDASAVISSLAAASGSASVRPLTSSAPSSSGPSSSIPSRIRPLEGQDFQSMLQLQSEKTFAVGTCVVKIEASKSTVASVYDGERRIGTISTAEPLISTRGLKATCSHHKMKNMKDCTCWLRFQKSQNVENKDRMEMLVTLATWLVDGLKVDRESHFEESWTLRATAGMNPRAGTAASSSRTKPGLK